MAMTTRPLRIMIATMNSIPDSDGLEYILLESNEEIDISTHTVCLWLILWHETIQATLAMPSFA